MTTQFLTLSVPEILLNQLKNRARLRQRSVEDETLELLAASVPGDELSSDLSADVKQLSLLDNEALMRAAQSCFAPEAAAKLEALHHKRQDEGLSATEHDSVESLVQQYERTMLVRAQAAAILQERGQDISGLGVRR